MRDWNLILLAKLGWRFLTDNNGLWVKVLSEKYLNANTTLFNASDSGNISQVWRSMLAGRKILDNGIVKCIGDGTKTKFWTDKWCGNVQLANVAKQPITTSQMDETVNMLWTGTQWNFDLLNIWLETDIIDKVRNYICAPIGDAKDELSWRLTSNGIFTVKSAYETLIPNSLIVDNMAKTIWKLNVLPRTRNFMWLMWKHKLLTNLQRRVRQLTDDESCQMCTWVVEDQLHVFRDCERAAAVWEAWVPYDMKNFFFSASWDEWLSFNLVESQAKVVHNLRWPSIFSSLCWKIWGWRNEECMGNKKRNGEEKLHIATALIRELVLLSNNIPQPHKVETFLQWERPAEGWIKINSDGSWNKDLRRAGAGGVLRDSLGKWITGFEIKCGLCGIERAELWGILTGLRVAWRENYRRVELESDSMSSVDMIRKGVNAQHPLRDLIHAIHRMMQLDWECNIKYIQREKNQVADWFAKDSLSLHADFLLFQFPPREVVKLLLADVIGVSFSRFVRHS